MASEVDEKKPLLECVAERFDIKFNSFERSPFSWLSEVFILDQSWVLRPRALADDTVEKFREETANLELIRGRLPFQIPKLRPARDGELFYIEGNTFWTAYRFIAGEIPFTWYESHLATASQLEFLFQTLRKYHEATAGLAAPEKGKRYFDSTAQALKRSRALLSERANDRLTTALQRARESAKCNPENISYVHADWHLGNLVLCDGAVAGVLDWDWSHFNDPLEDVAFSVMMYLRDYRFGNFNFDAERLARLLEYYRLESERYPLFTEYLLLGAFFDLDGFAYMPGIPIREKYVCYQRQTVEDLCARFFNACVC